jgi:hypothetical protein
MPSQTLVSMTVKVAHRLGWNTRPHPEERGEASRLEGCSSALRRLGANWTVLRGRFAAPQDEGLIGVTHFSNFAFSAFTTFGGAKGEASPPIEAIWRTSVAVIGLTGDEAGRKTVRISGAIAPFMPAICIS